MNATGLLISLGLLLSLSVTPGVALAQAPGSGEKTQRAIPVVEAAAARALVPRNDCLDLLGEKPDELTPYAVKTETAYWLGTSNNACPKLALALGGGGSKAAPYAMGVLEGMLNTGLINHTQLISSVSGGGYAALWYYTELMRGDLANESNEQLTRRLKQSALDNLSPIRCMERDNLGHAFMSRDVFVQTGCAALVWAYQHDTPALAGEHSLVVDGEFVKRFPSTFAHRLFPQQAHMRYFQDVLARRGSWLGKGANEGIGATIQATWPRVTTQLALSALSLPMHYAMNGVFDWQRSLSPTAWSYRHGILRAYGLAYTDYSADIGEHRVRALEAHRESYSATKLDALYKRHAHIPYWLANASAAESRFFWAWSRPAFHSAAKQIFEIGVDRLGSGEYGFHKIEPKQYDDWHHALADGAFASAAFLDSEQLALANPVARVGVAAALLGANQNWGVTLGNVHPRAANSAWQQALPWPLYYAPPLYRTITDDNTGAPYVHLIDGGNTENLGLYSMLRRGAQMIVVADESVDQDGHMKDVCNVKNQVELIANGDGAPRYWLAMPTLANLETVCNQGLTYHYDASVRTLVPDDERSNVELIGRSRDIDEGRRSLRLKAKVLCHLRDGQWVIDRCRPKGWDEVMAAQRTRDWQLGYPMHDWPDAWIPGCVLRLDGVDADTLERLREHPSCEPGNGIRIHSRIALLKPAMELKQWRAQFDTSHAPTGLPITRCWSAYSPVTKNEINAYQPISRDTSKPPSADAYGCEAALFLKVNLPAPPDHCPVFPQQDVVITTLDSSQYIYAAFKDLAHWQAAQLGADVDKLTMHWQTKLDAVKANQRRLEPTLRKKHDDDCATDLTQFRVTTFY